MNLSKHQAEQRAEEILSRIHNTGKALAVFDADDDIFVISTTSVRYKDWLNRGRSLIGVYDENCPFHWLASDLEGGLDKAMKMGILAYESL